MMYKFTLNLETETKDPDEFAEEFSALVHAHFDGDLKPKAQITYLGRDKFPIPSHKQP